MPLAQLQRALANTYTNEDVRETLRRDPAAFARAYDLSPFELAWIASIGDLRLRGYTDALDRKRASECARSLPASAAYLGPRFRRECLRFARRVPLGEGSRRYREDAVAFARHLRSARVDPPIDGAARALLAYETRSGTHAGWYAYAVADLAEAALRGDTIAVPARRWTLVIGAFGREYSLRIPGGRGA